MKSNKSAFKTRYRRPAKTNALLRERFTYHVHHVFMVATPHGLVHLARPKRTRFERIFWMICIVLVAIPCVLIGREAWNHYFHAPTVSSLMRDYQMWKHTFPALSICPAELTWSLVENLRDYWEPTRIYFDNHGFEMYDAFAPENETWLRSEERKNITLYVLEFLNILLYSNLSSYATLGKYNDTFHHIDPEDYLYLNDITGRPWSGSEVLEDMRFSLDQTVTEIGICYSINSMLANYSSLKYNALTGHLHPLRAINFRRFIGHDMSRIDHFHTSDIQPFEEDPYFHVAGIQMATKVYVHSYNEVITNRDKGTALNEQMALSMFLTVEKHTVKEDVRELSVEQRHCRFPEESNLRYFTVYSYNLCRLECKMNLAMKYCQCFPFYYRRLYKEKVCGIDGMICLSRHERVYSTILDKLTTLVQYFNLIAVELTMLRDNRGNDLCDWCERNCENELINLVNSQLVMFMFNAQVEVFLSLMVQTRIQISTIFTSTDFIVQIGGLLGLAYGVGILSAIELVYFVTIRLYFAVFRGRIVKV